VRLLIGDDDEKSTRSDEPSSRQMTTAQPASSNSSSIATRPKARSLRCCAKIIHRPGLGEPDLSI
jgi:hypothetical protein